MNVLILNGSPRKQGNSATLAEHLAGAMENATVTRRDLYFMQYKGCMGCMACRKKRESCILEDDLTPVLREMHEADVVIFATPNYNGGPPGEMKCLIDRCFSFLRTDHFEMRAVGITQNTSRLPLGKTAVALFVQGQNEQGMNEFGKESVFITLCNKLRSMGFPYVEEFRCCRLNGAKDSLARTDLLIKAEALGKELSQRYAVK